MNVINCTHIASGDYSLKQRSFGFKVEETLPVISPEKPSLIFISGENGAGKSTFLEQVIIPKLKSSNILFHYIGQEMKLQNIVNRSMEAIISIVYSKSSKFRKVFKQSNIHKFSTSAEVLLLDEVDKSLSDIEFWNLISEKQYKTVVIISHNLNTLLESEKVSSWENSFIIKIHSYGKIRKVRMQPC